MDTCPGSHQHLINRDNLWGRIVPQKILNKCLKKVSNWGKLIQKFSLSPCCFVIEPYCNTIESGSDAATSSTEKHQYQCHQFSTNHQGSFCCCDRYQPIVVDQEKPSFLHYQCLLLYFFEYSSLSCL